MSWFLLALTGAAPCGALHHVPSIKAQNGGVFVDGNPFVPAGFINHAHLRGPGTSTRSYEREVVEGFNTIFTYRGIPGQGEGRWGNESWPDTMAFLDRCAAVGVKVFFDFSQNAMLTPKSAPMPPPLEVVRDAVTRLRGHPAILTWYLIDEPDGRLYPPEWVAEAARIIRSIDARRPISMCFDTTDKAGGTWPKYVNSTDILLADIYPVTRQPGACTAAAGCNITSMVGDSIRQTVERTGLPVWYIPQAFGSQEGYLREPSAGEVRSD